MSNSAEIKAKIERMRKEKQQREEDRKQKELESKNEKTTQSASKVLIDKLLSLSEKGIENLNNPMEDGGGVGTGKANQSVPIAKSLSKICSLVVEIEIAPKRKPETYAREVQCEILNSKKLSKIREGDEDQLDEDSSDNFDERFSQRVAVARQSMRRDSTLRGGVEARRTETAAPNAKQNAEKEIVTKEMPKDEAKRLMQSQDFINWFSKSSRHVERALSCEFDIQEEFFTAVEIKENNTDDV